MARPKKNNGKKAVTEVKTSVTEIPIEVIELKDMPLLVTIIGTEQSKNLKTGKEYPETHRILAHNLIKKGHAKLKT